MEFGVKYWRKDGVEKGYRIQEERLFLIFSLILKSKGRSSFIV